MKKQKILIFSFLILMMIGGMTLTFIISQNMTKGGKEPTDVNVQENVEKTNKNQEPNEDGLEGDESQNEPSERDSGKDSGAKTPLKAKDIYKVPEKKNTEYISERDAMIHVNTAKKYFQRFEFSKGAEYLYEFAQKYREEDGGLIIHTLHYDASLLANLEHHHEHEMSGEGHAESMEGKMLLLKSIRDPQMALLGVLSLELEERNHVIPTLDSLNPVFEGEIQLLSQNEEVGHILDTLSFKKGAERVYRIDFNVDGYNLYAIVYEDKNGYSQLYGIYAEKGSTSYLTVEKWNELFAKSSKPRPKQEASQIHDAHDHDAQNHDSHDH